MTEPHPHNSIRTFALICVAITSLFIMAMIIWSTFIMASSEWCGRSIGAEKAAPGRTLDGLKSCINLMTDQISALAWNSHIYAGTISLCLVALMLIVVAGGRISFSASKTGLSGNIARDDPGDVDPPIPVVVTQPPNKPVPTKEAPAAEEHGE